MPHIFKLNKKYFKKKHMNKVIKKAAYIMSDKQCLPLLMWKKLDSFRNGENEIIYGTLDCLAHKEERESFNNDNQV